MQWFLDASTTGHKFALMVVAILLFAAVMGAILFAVDRPKRVPNWLVAAGFLAPTLVLLLVGLVYPALETIRGSFYDRDGSDLMPGEIGAGAMWTELTNWIANDKPTQQVLTDVENAWPAS